MFLADNQLQRHVTGSPNTPERHVHRRHRHCDMCRARRIRHSDMFTRQTPLLRHVQGPLNPPQRHVPPADAATATCGEPAEHARATCAPAGAATATCSPGGRSGRYPGSASAPPVDIGAAAAEAPVDSAGATGSRALPDRRHTPRGLQAGHHEEVLRARGANVETRRRHGAPAPGQIQQDHHVAFETLEPLQGVEHDARP